MATVLIIHAAEDALPARALAEKLRQAQLSVVLEKPLGEDLRNAARTAQVAVALWSPRSAQQQDMFDDVAFVRAKSKVVHAGMQNTPTPEAFRDDESANLTGWRGEDDFPAWRELAQLVTEAAGVAGLAPPAARVGSGFFQPGRVEAGDAAGAPPPRRAPPLRPVDGGARVSAREPEPIPAYEPLEPERGGGGMLIAILAFVILAGLGGGGYFFWQQQQSAHAASAAWDQIDRNDPAALRAFIGAQSGPLKTQAEGALSELEERSFEAASDADTIEALQSFLHDFPDSQHALAARGRIAELQATANAGPQGVDATTDITDQPQTNGDLVPPGTTPQASGGGPAPLTPPSEPENPQEPPSAPATTTP
jgi:hypothetical protein